MQEENKHWVLITDEESEITQRLMVEGGYIYRSTVFNDKFEIVSVALTHVPDVDLQRYQAHLRDAYKKGYEAGQEDYAAGHINQFLDGAEIKS